MKLHFFHSIILTTLLVSSAACAPKTQSISLRCNGEALEVREQNDLPLSHALNSYKFARVSYNGSPLHLEITTEGFSYGNADWDISPHSYGIEGLKKGNKLNFEINRPGYIVVRFSKDQDFTKRLLILVEEAEELPDGELVDIVRDYQVDNTGARNETDKIQQALNDISGSAKVLFFPVEITSALDFRFAVTVIFIFQKMPGSLPMHHPLIATLQGMNVGSTVLFT